MAHSQFYSTQPKHNPTPGWIQPTIMSEAACGVLFDTNRGVWGRGRGSYFLTFSPVFNDAINKCPAKYHGNYINGDPVRQHSL